MENPPRRRPTPQRRTAPTPEAADKPVPTAVVAVRKLFAAETPEYFLLLGTTVFLLAFGLVMVLSSSSIESRVGDGDFFARATRQGLFAVVALPVMLMASRLPMIFWKKWAGRFLVISLVLQLLVFIPGIGYGYGGNRNWIQFGSFTAQPSETIKFALVLWLAWILVAQRDRLDDWRSVLIPIGPVAFVAVGLVLAGNDLGTASVMLLIILGAMFYAGVRLRYLLLAVTGLALAAVLLVNVSASRSDRFSAWLSGCVDPALLNDECWQTVHGWEALAHGGILGVGLGNSAGKWSWIPEADNDFIFAIIGEELGLVGALLVIGLYLLLAVCFVRIIRMQRDPFAKIATSAAMVWIVGQALVNIAVVLGLLPVLGVPLPLVSAGGSALVTTMGVIGVVLSFARQRPASVEDTLRVPRAGRIVR